MVREITPCGHLCPVHTDTGTVDADCLDYLGVCQAPVTHCTGRVSPETGLQEQDGLMCQDCKAGETCGV